MKKLMFIMGPPLSDFPEPPNDQPGSKLTFCPQCGCRMWLSFKKRELRKILNINEQITACYKCITKLIAENTSYFKDNITKVNI